MMIHVYNILCDSITRPKLEAVMRFVFVLHATELSLVSGVFFIKSLLLAEKFEQSQTRSCSHLRFFSGVQYQAMLERSNFHRKYHQQLAPGLKEYKVSENTHQCHVIKWLRLFSFLDIHVIMIILSDISPLGMLALAAEKSHQK